MKKQLEYLTHIFRKITARLKNTSVFLLKTLYSVIARRDPSLSLRAKRSNLNDGSGQAPQSLLTMLKRTNLREIATAIIDGLAMTKQNKPKMLFSLGLLYLFFLAFPYPQSLFTKTKLQIYGNNNSSVLHAVLADSYLGVYDYSGAKKELSLAIASQPSQEIEKKLALVSVWETRPETLNKDLVSWKKITKEKPDFRDGFFQEALVLYQLKRLDEAKIVLEKVFLLDPNFESGRRLEKELL